MKYIIIVGCGKTGRGLATELSVTDNVVVVDKDTKALESLGDDFNGKKIWGDVLDLNTLENAGIKDTDVIFLLTGNDNINLVVGTVVKRKYNIKNVILQLSDVIKKRVFKEEGLTIVNPTYMVVEVLKKRIS